MGGGGDGLHSTFDKKKTCILKEARAMVEVVCQS